tara:strand:+ start:79 stop:333 length:255 start_codon:yes stop_codon:yes gene_type:complete
MLNVESLFVLDQKAGQAKEVELLEEGGTVKTIIMAYKMKGCALSKKKASPMKLKDACYYKAKKAHKVFPSAYASGMIAKCRKNK